MVLDCSSTWIRGQASNTGALDEKKRARSGKRKPDQGSKQLDAYVGKAEGCCSERSNQLGRKPAGKETSWEWIKAGEQAQSPEVLKIRRPALCNEQVSSAADNDQGSKQLDAYVGKAEGCCSERSNQLGRKPAGKETSWEWIKAGEQAQSPEVLKIRRPALCNEQVSSAADKSRKEQNKGRADQLKRRRRREL
ncbi:hypothetical protein F511_35973 [Dorcoceras hygrometricum]|uniref:Uncharacterized protein n=1 Tax=Dorcoceras hygrometricum TaxID=472368 RepID=A0A2Z7A7G4_9LAMI|nr:hypothetical protein F511_35973 [Dorcoceras hygrometricum]